MPFLFTLLDVFLSFNITTALFSSPGQVEFIYNEDEAGPRQGCETIISVLFPSITDSFENQRMNLKSEPDGR